MSNYKIFVNYFIFKNLNMPFLVHAIVLWSIFLFVDLSLLMKTIIVTSATITSLLTICSFYYQNKHKIIDNDPKHIYLISLIPLALYYFLKSTDVVNGILYLDLLFVFIPAAISSAFFLRFIVIAKQTQRFVELVKSDYNLRNDIISSFKWLDGDANHYESRGKHVYYPFQDLTFLKTNIFLSGSYLKYEDLTFIEREFNNSCINLNQDEQNIAKMILI